MMADPPKPGAARGGGGGGADRPAWSGEHSLVATMVHDLKNPLAALAGNLAILREELAGPPALSPTATRCLEDSIILCTRALMMAQAIADVEALEAGTVVARPVLTRVRPEVDAAIAMVVTNLRARDLSLEVDVADDAVVIVDGRLLAHVVQNLLDNAVRYAARGGRIRVAVTAIDRKLVLEVGNDGLPLTDDERTSVFEREFRSAERAGAARLGRDFGLYFCHLVAAAHHGSITVEQRPELTTVFVVRIPA